MDGQVAREGAGRGIVAAKDQRALAGLDERTAGADAGGEAGAALGDRPDEVQRAGARVGGVGGGEDDARAERDGAIRAEPARAETAVATIDDVEDGVVADDE